jgi:hypothetical protein
MENAVAEDAVAPRPLPSRLAAAGIHFSLSLVVFAIALYLILAHWYPGFHFAADGGWQGVRIMIGVDLVLGPLLTLVVFNPRKARHLIAFDLSCIGVTQVAALVWGFYAVHSQRPVAVSFHEGEFWSMTAAPLEIEGTEEGFLERLSNRAPALVYVRPPANEGEESRKALQAMVGGVADHEDPFFFEPFAPHWDEVQAKAVTAGARSRAHAPFAAALPRFLERNGGGAGDYRYFPYTGRHGECTLVFRPTGTLVDGIGCAPF